MKKSKFGIFNQFFFWNLTVCVLLWLSHKRNVTLCLKRSINWAYNMQANSESLSWLASFGETTMTRKHGGSKLFWTLGSMPEDNRYVDNRFHHQQQQHSHTHGIKRLVRFSQNHKKFEIVFGCALHMWWSFWCLFGKWHLYFIKVSKLKQGRL